MFERKFIQALGFGSLALSLAVACQDKQSPANQQTDEQAEPNTESEATAGPSVPAVNPEIANVVQQATKQGLKPDATGAAGPDGPPPNGILDPQKADAEAKPNTPPTLTIGSEGSSPRVTLGGAPPSDERIGQLEVSIQTGPRTGMPVVQYKLSAQVEEIAAQEGAVSGKQLSFEVVEASAANNQIGQLPPGAAEAIATLKGSKFAAPFVDGGLLQTLSPTESEKTKPEVASLLSFATDALTSLVITYPDKPVGKDAAWMTTSRQSFAGTDVVVYRLYRLNEVTPDGAVIGVNTRRYVASGRLGLPNIAEHELVHFQGTDDGQFRVVNGHWLPAEGRLQQRLGATLVQTNSQEGRVSLEIRTLFAFPPKPGVDVAGEASKAAAGTAPAEAAAQPTPRATPPAQAAPPAQVTPPAQQAQPAAPQQ